ncbi:flagellar basal-body rod protein FlgB [Lebetimonas natsushimae]|uniref:Flagellar basal body rod protein FlgB n=1 Tax=Lebetimonas natsushimae TaxID=1936991 RepID=A0A292YBJ6_9BACT|nr:flagellar basal body rod protein FlgB [Lebetimonas natsushimae]GAX86820.1 flagellar basal-body rod protein FlgB [Lebetimonas natsushimae]
MFKTINFLEKSLGYRKIRQDLIASNIANADTPNYRPRDIRFEEALKSELENKPIHKLELAKTSPMHMEPKNINDDIKPVVFFRDGHLARNDGNSVDIDVETTEMAKNTIMYNAEIAAVKKRVELFKLVIDSSKSI